MGVSTDGILAFGFAFDEEDEMPWVEDYGHNCEEDWYYESVLRYDSEHNTHEEYIEFKVQNPMPFKAVMYCSESCPQYIIASQSITVRRGWVKEVSTLDIDQEKAKLLKQFCLDQGLIEPEDEPKWWLASYWSE